MGFIQGEGRTQRTLFPVTLEELIPEDHVCRVIDGFVDRLDMAGFEVRTRRTSRMMPVTPTVSKPRPVKPEASCRMFLPNAPSTTKGMARCSTEDCSTMTRGLIPSAALPNKR
jgi:hypothetical protein